MRQDVYFRFGSPPDPAADIVRRELTVTVNGQRRPQVIRAKTTDERVLIDSFPEQGGELVEVSQVDVSRNRRRTDPVVSTFTVPAPPKLAQPAPGTFDVEPVFEAGEGPETDEPTAEPAPAGTAPEATGGTTGAAGEMPTLAPTETPTPRPTGQPAPTDATDATPENPPPPEPAP